MSETEGNKPMRATYSPMVSLGNILSMGVAVISTAGVLVTISIAWADLNNRALQNTSRATAIEIQVEKDRNRFEQLIDNMEDNYEDLTSELERRVRNVEQSGAVINERLSSMLALLQLMDDRLERIEKKP